MKKNLKFISIFSIYIILFSFKNCIYQKDDIVGNWELCSKVYKNGVKSYFACPKIQFNNDFEGKVYNRKEHFKWSLSKDSLYIYKSIYIGNDILNDSIYLISISQKKKFIELRLKSLSYGYELILGK